VKKLALPLSILALVFGGILLALGSFGMMYGLISVVLAIALLVAFQMYPNFLDSRGGLIVSLILCVSGGMWVVEELMLMMGGPWLGLNVIAFALSILTIILCPVMCRQSTSGVRTSVIGIASAHESISMSEIAKKTGLSQEVVTKTVYDAIGKGQLSGQMQGDTFKRTGPSTALPPDAKVLVICPYCGAKTEQGLAKCQKCNADL